MEGSRNMSMAQLSAWTDAMKKTNNGNVHDNKMSSKPQSKPTNVNLTPQNDDDENDYGGYEEEFEEFEEEEEEEKQKQIYIAPPKAQVAPAVSSKSSKSVIPILPSTTIHPTSLPEASAAPKSSRTKHYDSLSVSLSRSIADPRTVRIQRVLKSGVLNLQLEKFTHLNLTPTTKYDYYINDLRNPNSSLKQAGVPNDLEFREIEVNTDDIERKSKGIQCFHGDDTYFFNLLQSIRDFKKSGQKQSNQLEHYEDSASQPAHYDGQRTLSVFLEKSSLICETLLTERAGNMNVNIKDHKQHSLELINASNIQSFGLDTKNGANELIRTRLVNYIEFSKLQPQRLILSHPYPVSSNEIDSDLRPFKALYSVWDINSLGGPLYILEASGQASCGCFSNSQMNIIVAGTQDGCLHVWDLAESNSIHKDNDSIDLRILSGIRKPSYSTHIGSNGDEMYHSYSISQVIALNEADRGFSGSTISQFASIDESGTVVFWITSENSVMFSDFDFRKRHGSKTSLIATRQINVFKTFDKAPPMDRPGDDRRTKANMIGTGAILSSNISNDVIIYPIPDDSSHLLAAVGNVVKRISRLGASTYPYEFYRERIPTHDVLDGKLKKNKLDLTKTIHAVSCMTVNSSNHLAFKTIPRLLLVGRKDGSVDLFRMDQEHPIQTWQLNSDEEDKQVIHLRWSEGKSLSFFAVLSSGEVVAFDLLREMYKPVQFGRISKFSAITTKDLVFLSKGRADSDPCNLVFIDVKNRVCSAQVSLPFDRTENDSDFAKAVENLILNHKPAVKTGFN